MITLDIPGWGHIDIEFLLLDLNGTIATDGKISPEVRDKINTLSKQVKIYVLTADTYQTGKEETKGLGVEWVQVSEENSTLAKVEVLKSLGPERLAAIGNGSNDQEILKEAALGIAVLGKEGLSVAAMKKADLVVNDITEALDLFLKPRRLVATLRE